MENKSSKYIDKNARKALLHRKEMALKRKNPTKYRKYLLRKRKRQLLRILVLFLLFAVPASVLTGTVIGIKKICINVSESRQQKKEERVKARQQAAEEAEKARAEEEARLAAEEHGQDITLGATGCMLMHGPITRSKRYANGNGGFDYSDIYKYITPYYSAPDFMTCEFEGSFTGEDYEGFPTFHVPDEIAVAYTNSGIDLQMMASNHMFDGLSEGFHRSMEMLDSKHLAYTGIRRNAEDKRYYLADIQGIKVGYINYVYEQESDYGTHGLNKIPIEDADWELINTFHYDHLDTFYNEIKTNLDAMKADGAEFLIANMHWGTEYHLQESEIQREIAQKLCDMGVDAIIGGHPHCIQPIDVLTSSDGSRNMFCIYSVGNALSNQRRERIDEMNTGHTEDGVIVLLTVNRNKEGLVRLTGVDLIPTWVYMDGDGEDENNLYYILPLDDIDRLAQDTGIPDIRSYAKQSYDRTMEVFSPGLEKAQAIFHANDNMTESSAENTEKTEKKDASEEA